MNIFIGEKAIPTYMLEFNNNNSIVQIYKPDKHSKNLEDFYEKYSLGKLVAEMNYEDVIYINGKPELYGKRIYKSFYTPQLLLKIDNDYFLINKKISKIKTKI